MEHIKATRVLIAAPLYPPQIGGPATHVVLLERELPGWGVEVRVVPFSRVSRLPKVLRHLAYLFLLVKQGIGTQVIYALDPVSVGFPASLAATLLRKRFVLRVGGDYAWEQGVERFGVTWMLDDFLTKENISSSVRTLQKVQSYVASHAAVVIVPSQYLAGVVRAWGVKERNIVVAYSSPNPPPSIAREDARARLNLDENTFVILSAGRLVPWKGFSTLVSAVGKMSQGGDVLLAIAGAGPEQAHIENVIEERGLGGRVRMLGRLGREEIAHWLAAADVFALNTGYEGFSHQLLEAMQMGIPVLTTRVGGNTELVEDGVSGVLVPYNDINALSEALTRLQGDTSLRARLAHAGKSRAAEFKESDSLTTIVRVLTL